MFRVFPQDHFGSSLELQISPASKISRVAEHTFDHLMVDRCCQVHGQNEVKVSIGNVICTRWLGAGVRGAIFLMLAFPQQRTKQPAPQP